MSARFRRAEVVAGPAPAPAGLPLLSRGRHGGPDEGACVMEYVSVLAGERFADAPRCTHSALATLARLVNDRIADDGIRSSLALLAPDLIAADRRDPRVTDCAVAACLLGAAGARDIGSTWSRRLARACARQRRPRPSSRLRDVVGSRCRTAFHPPSGEVVAAFVVWERAWPQPGPDRDRRLRSLLVDAVTDARNLVPAGAPAVRPTMALRR